MDVGSTKMADGVRDTRQTHHVGGLERKNIIYGHELLFPSHPNTLTST